jgi:hypothetical protein
MRVEGLASGGWTVALFAALLVVALAPIWGVPYHITQDGPAHVYSSKVLIGLLRNDPAYTGVYSFTPAPVPNSIGHWLTASMLLVVGQFTAAKLISSLSFAGLVGSVAWLWMGVSEGTSPVTGVMYGLAIAFNWLWLEGFTNFTIGLALYALAVGLFARWNRLNVLRILILALLGVALFFSHELCFAALLLSTGLFALARARSDGGRSLVFLAGALTPAVVLVVVYHLLAPAGAVAANPWEGLPETIADWATRIRTTNPFMIILTRWRPFSDAATSYNPLFAPVIWMFAAVVCLLIGRFKGARSAGVASVFTILCVIFAAAALFAPDALAGGSLLRPRMAMFAAIAIVPVISRQSVRGLRLVATVLLSCVFVYQTAAMWDYSLTTSRDAGDLMAASNAFHDGDGLVAVAVLSGDLRYPTMPLAHADGFLPGDRSSVVWDVYETSLPTFPVIAKTAADRDLIYRLNSWSVILGPGADEREGFLRTLDEAGPRVNVVAICNGDDSLLRSLARHGYEPLPEISRGETKFYGRPR